MLQSLRPKFWCSLMSFGALASTVAHGEAYENDYTPEFGRFRFEVREQQGVEPQVIVQHDPTQCQFTAIGTPAPCEVQLGPNSWEPRLIGDGVGVDHIEGQWSRFRFEGVTELERFRIIRLNPKGSQQPIVRLLQLDESGRTIKVYRLNRVAD